MDFKVLQQSHQQKNIQSTRYGVSEQQFQKGMALFEQAHDNGFTQIEYLQDACVAFIEAMKANRSDVRPYLSLGYIFYLLRDYTTATTYLRGALDLEPENPAALDLQRHIQEGVGASLRQPPSQIKSNQTHLNLPDPLPQTPQEYDDLYDRTEQWIFTQVKIVMEKPIPQLMMQEADLLQIEEYFGELQHGYQIFQQIIKILDEDIDTTDLVKRVQPLEITHKRYQRLLENSRTCIQLHHTILNEIKAIEQITQEAQNVDSEEDIAILEENMEVILDNFEHYSTHLEALSKKQLPVEDIMAIYKRLQMTVDQYQDILDDISANFTLPTDV